MRSASQPPTAVPTWRHFAHQADIGVESIGPTREAAFEQAALALSAVVTSPDRIQPQVAVDVECTAPSDEVLLVDWLNAIVFEMATRRMLFGRFAVTADGGRLHGRLWGEPVDQERHRPAVEVKGATYTALAVGSRPDGSWRAACVVDV